MKRGLFSSILDRLIALEHLSPQFKDELLNDLLGVHSDKAIIIWTTDDIISVAAEEMGKLVTEDEASEIIAEIEQDHDASIGVNWTVIKTHIEHMGLPDLSNTVRDAYENCVCPDCGEDIPINIIDGEHCSNCGHVFTANTQLDDHPSR